MMFTNYVTEAQRQAGRRVAAANSKMWRRKRAAWRAELEELRWELKDDPHPEALPIIHMEIARITEDLALTACMP